jgi:hypothetical protein
MRTLIILLIVATAGCASQPSAPAGAAVQSSAAAKPAQSIEEQRLAAAKNLNLKVVDKDGQQLYCRSNLMTATRIQRDVTCYTADQLDRLQEQNERDLNRLTTTPAAGPSFPQH